jgi:carbon storage regulator
MLILSRRVGQSIVIAGNIVVKVVRVDGDQIKIGTEAPREVSVHREEIQRDIDAGKPRLAGAEVSSNGDRLAFLLPTGGGFGSTASVPSKHHPEADVCRRRHQSQQARV